MHAADDVVAWVEYGLSLLLEVAGVVLALVHRKAHPTAARLAAVGLLCDLADSILGYVADSVYAWLARPLFSAPTLGHRYVVIEFAQQLTHFLLNLVGAAGWTLVFIAAFATRALPAAPAATNLEGAHPWNPSRAG